MNCSLCGRYSSLVASGDVLRVAMKLFTVIGGATLRIACDVML